MHWSVFTRVSMAARGDDLYVATVSHTPWRTTVRHGPTLRGFLSMPVEEAKAALAKLKGISRMTLVCDESWCATRPIQLRASQWKRAREEVRLSVDKLLPLPADDALVGVVDMDDSVGDGALIAVRQSIAQMWIDRIEQATGGRVTELLSPHMAMLALGHQREAEARVIDIGPDGEPVGEHRFRFGAPTQFDAPFSDRDAREPGSYAAGPRDHALAGALAPLIGGGRYAPLAGRIPSAPKRWLVPACAAGLAIIVFLGAGTLYKNRLASATQRAEARQVELVEPLTDIRQTQREAERYLKLIRDGVQAPTSEWQSVMPVLAEVDAALGDEGFLRRLEITPTHIAIQGESPSATAVLESMEASPLLEGAQLSAPTSRSNQSGLDMFSIRARRTAGGAS